MPQRCYLKSIISKVFFTSIVFFANIALASNRAGAYFVYDYGQMIDVESKLKNIDWNAKFLFQNSISIDWNNTNMVNEGGKIFLLQTEFPVELGSFILTPSFSIGTGEWENGDFQYFYGKPDLPYINGIDISLSYSTKHLLNASYYFGNAKILNKVDNETYELFNSDFYFGNIFYRYACLYAGFAVANIKANGSLTAENQRYFLFPYNFYNLTGDLRIRVVYSMVDFRFAKLGVAYAIDGEMKGNMHYKYRKFYGTEEFFETLEPVQFKGSGFIFCLLGLETRKMRIGENYIQYGVFKPLAMPFGNVSPTSEVKPNRAKLLKDLFLLGLTARVNIFF